jgi:hypothetical protein
VGVETSQGHKGNLPVQAKRSADLNDLRATCLSWLAISVFGNAVASVDPELKASAKTRPCCNALVVTELAD